MSLYNEHIGSSHDFELIITQNIQLIFLAALELATAERNSEALRAIGYLPKPMGALISAIISGSIASEISPSQAPHCADAWEALAETIAQRCTEPATLQFAMLSSLGTGAQQRTAARKFYESERWSAVTLILGNISSASPMADADFFRELGISLYHCNKYTDSASALIAAVELGDTSPETLAYISWLENKPVLGETSHD